MKSLTVTELRKNLYKIVEETAMTHHPVHISGKKNGAVLVGEDDWRAIQETLYLTSIPGMRESIIEGLETPPKETSDKLDWGD